APQMTPQGQVSWLCHLTAPACTGVVRVLCGDCRWSPPRPHSTLTHMAVPVFGLISSMEAALVCPGSSKSSKRQMSNSLCQPPAAPATGESFDQIVLPHLDAAYRLARWQMRNEHDAEDV